MSLMQEEPFCLTKADERQEKSVLGTFLAQQQKADVTMQVTDTAKLVAKAEITNGGLLSIAALVAAILLSTAVVVQVSTRHPRQPLSLQIQSDS